MKAHRLKAEAISWLRFKKFYNIICTELWTPLGIADVFGLGPRNVIDPRRSIEIEVKVSKSDIKADFKKKSPKHDYYKHGLNLTPSYMYFLVPESLGDYVEKSLDDNGLSRYGVLIVPLYGGALIQRKPAELNKNKPSQYIYEQCIKRMGNEVYSFHRSVSIVDDKKNIRNEAVRFGWLQQIPGNDNGCSYDLTPGDAPSSESIS